MAAVISMFILPNNTDAGQGSELAKEMLQKIGTASTEKDLNAFLQKAAQEKSRLSTEGRIDFAEYLYSLMASDTGTNEGEVSWPAAMLMSGGISEQETRAGRARLLSSNDPAVREFGENMELAGNVKLPNGQTGQDISVFDLALHDPKVPQDRLIAALFKLAPVESAQWFTDHTDLPADERAGLESDLQKAWQLHRAVNDPSADPATKAILDDKVKKPLLLGWSKSPSWILRSLASGLLRKHQEWQTPDVKDVIQEVPVPDGVQVSSTAGQPGSK